MSATTFKTKAKKYYNSAVNNVSSFYEKTKTKVKKYKSTVDNAYLTGYKSGWRDATKVSSDFVSRTSATIGYGKGLRNHHRTVKYTNQFNK